MARESKLPALACGRADCQFRDAAVVSAPPVQLSLFNMPFAPEVQHLIQQVEQLFDPTADIGFDISAEYAEACWLNRGL